MGAIPLPDGNNAADMIRRLRAIDAEFFGTLYAAAGVIGGDVVIEGTLSANDIHSSTWDGALPLALPDVTATTGYALDDSLGIGQFKTLYASGAFITDLVAAEITVGQIAGSQISDLPTSTLTGVITTAQIDALAVTQAKVALNAIDTAQIAADAITAGELANLAVDTEHIAALAISAAKVQALAISTGMIQLNAVDTAQIAPLAVGTTEVQLLAIDSTLLGAEAVTGPKIAALSVTAAKIAANTITASQIFGGTITATEIASNAITAIKIDAGAVTADKILANVITGTHIAGTTITAANIFGDTITAAQIAGGTITAAEILGLTITASEINTDAITADKILASAVTTVKLDADAVTAAKLSAINIEVGKYLRSTSYVAGVSGWSIDAAGSAEFNDVTVRGVIEATSGTLGSLSITGALTAAYGVGSLSIGETTTAEFNLENEFTGVNDGRHESEMRLESAYLNTGAASVGDKWEFISKFMIDPDHNGYLGHAPYEAFRIWAEVLESDGGGYDRQGPQVLFADGSAQYPSIGFISTHDLGFYHKAVDSVGFSSNGTERWYWDANNLALRYVNTNSVRHPYGTVSIPGIGFEGEADTGLFRHSANVIGFANAGVQTAVLTASGLYFSGTGGARMKMNAVGTVALPALTFDGDTDTGIYRKAANELAISTAGVLRLYWDATFGRWNFNSTVLGNVNEIYVDNGSVSDPSYTFTSDTLEGMYLDSGTGSPALTQEGAQTMTLQNSWVWFGTGEALPTYRKDANGVVYVQGLIKNGTTTSGTVVATLPAGYRPAGHFHCGGISNNAWCQMKMNSNGELHARNGWSSSWVSINFSFPT